jgi:hypothetical protein
MVRMSRSTAEILKSNRHQIQFVVRFMYVHKNRRQATIKPLIAREEPTKHKQNSTQKVPVYLYTIMKKHPIPTASFLRPNNAIIVDGRLQALGVPVVLLDTLGARSAVGSAGVALTAALSVLLSNGSAGSSSRLSDGGKSALGGGDNLSGSRNSSLSGGRGGSLGGRGRRSDLSGGRSSRSSGTSTVPELRSWNGVAGVGSVEVEEDTSVLSAEVSRDGHTGRQSSGARATDLDVNALNNGLAIDLESIYFSALCATYLLVELRTTNTVTLVKSDDLRADDVLARCNLGQNELVLSCLACVRALDELLDSPRLAIVAVLSNLRP